MDAWAADPDNWAVPSHSWMSSTTSLHGGYTLGFHDGGLQTCGMDTSTPVRRPMPFSPVTSRSTPTTAFSIHVRNRLDAGDVLEFVLPGDDIRREFHDVRLRLYEFELDANQLLDVIHPGQPRQASSAGSQFEREDQATLSERTPPLTVIRKRSLSENPNPEYVWTIRLDGWNWQQATPAEARAAQVRTSSSISFSRVHSPKPTRSTPMPNPNPIALGSGRRGRGCNGCLVFGMHPRLRQGWANDEAEEDRRDAEPQCAVGEGAHLLIRAFWPASWSKRRFSPSFAAVLVCQRLLMVHPVRL